MRGIVKGGLNDGGGSNIKSIQYGDTSMSGSTLDIPISIVDLTKSIAIVSYTSGTDAANTSSPMAQFPNAGILNISTAGISNSTISWRVIEFNNVKSLQKGSITLSATGNVPATITAVNRSKSIVVGSFKTNDTNTNAKHQMQRWHLPTDTTVEVYFGESISNGTAYYFVVEFI